MPGTWTLVYTARAKCSSCNAVFWCDDSVTPVSCLCGCATLLPDGTNSGASNVSDLDMKQAFLSENYDVAGIRGPATLDQIVVVAT